MKPKYNIGDKVYFEYLGQLVGGTIIALKKGWFRYKYWIEYKSTYDGKIYHDNGLFSESKIISKV